MAEADVVETYADVVRGKSHEELETEKTSLQTTLEEIQELRQNHIQARDALNSDKETVKTDFKRECIQAYTLAFDDEDCAIPDYEAVRTSIRAVNVKIADEQHIIDDLEHRLDDVRQRLATVDRRLLAVVHSRAAVLEESLKNESSTMWTCELCLCSLTIPTVSVAWECDRPGPDGKVHCRKSICLDCFRAMFHLNEHPSMRPQRYPCPHGCQHLGQHVAHRSTHDVYYVDEREMEHLDEMIRKFSGGAALVECIKCHQWFKTTRDLWRHKRGDGVPPCPESTRMCKCCHKFSLAKNMIDDYCTSCHRIHVAVERIPRVGERAHRAGERAHRAGERAPREDHQILERLYYDGFEL